VAPDTERQAGVGGFLFIHIFTSQTHNMLHELVHPGRIEGTRIVKTYRNVKTGTEIKLSLIHEDTDGKKYWGFIDLYKMPIMRSSMAKNITDMYTIGLTLKDILNWCNQEKELLKGDDPEKYEKLYALILEKEKLATYTADPIKQQLALTTVYVLEDDERIDYFDEAEAERKLKTWAGRPDLVSFFLTWQTDHIGRYMKTLAKVSQIVSAKTPMAKGKK
jgi:hypothetical protein